MAYIPRHEFLRRQLHFAQEYISSLDVLDAYKRAGYSGSTRISAYKVLRRPYVQEQIKRLMAEREQRTAINADVVLGEILRLARADVIEAFDPATGALRAVHDIPEGVRRAISGCDVKELFDKNGEKTGHLVKIRFWDKTRALELLAKHLGLLIERHVIGGSLADMLMQVEAIAADGTVANVHAGNGTTH